MILLETQLPLADGNDNTNFYLGIITVIIGFATTVVTLSSHRRNIREKQEHIERMAERESRERNAKAKAEFNSEVLRSIQELRSGIAKDGHEIALRFVKVENNIERMLERLKNMEDK